MSSASAVLYDPNTNKFYYNPDELKTVDPLILKAYFHPEQLTPEEREEVHLKLFSFVFDFQSNTDLKKMLKDVKAAAKEGSATPFGPEFNFKLAEMFEGKVALREMGCTKRRKLKVTVIPNTIAKKPQRRKKRAKKKDL